MKITTCLWEVVKLCLSAKKFRKINKNKKQGFPARKDNRSPEERTMKNAPKGKYSGVVQEVKQALTIILGEAELLLRQEEGLSQEGRKKLEGIKAQVLRIDKLLEKVK